MRYSRGKALVEVIIVVVVVVLLGAISLPHYRQADTASKIARAQSEMRTLGLGLEVYNALVGDYPVVTTDFEFSMYNELFKAPKPVVVGRTFRRATIDLDSQPVIFSLTTPVAFIEEYPSDPFGDVNEIGYLYYTDGPGWIISSLGPNSVDDMGFRNEAVRGLYGVVRKMDPPRADIENYFSSSIRQPSQWLLAGRAPRPAFSGPPAAPSGIVSFTYDPTNGAYSVGNIYRVSPQQPPNAMPESAPIKIRPSYDPTNGIVGGSSTYRVKQ